MTKDDFKQQFKRLRLCGYRLPVFDGVSIADVIDEWYQTFSGCSAVEFSNAVDRLKRTKTDTFWPATGELWEHINDVRRAARIRRESQQVDADGPEVSPELRAKFVNDFRQFKERMLGKTAMSNVKV